MPNTIKHSTDIEANALGVGDMHIGTGDVAKGPTQTTGFYNGVNPPSGGYTIYQNKASQGPSIICPSSDDDLIVITNGIADASYTTINECFTYFAEQSDKMVMNTPIGEMVTNGCNIMMDPSNILSWPGSGTILYDLSGNANNTTLYNGAAVNSDGFLELDGVDDYGQITNNSTLQGWAHSQSLAMWLYHDIQSGRRNPWDQAYGGYGTWTHEGGAQISQYFGNSGANSQPYVGYSSADVPENKWTLMTTVRGTSDTTGHKWYRNGELTYTRSNPYGVLEVTNANPRIGRGYAGYWAGRMGKIMTWESELTDSDVKALWYGGYIVTDDLSFSINAGVLGSFEPGTTTANSQIGTVTGTLTNGVGFNSSSGGYWEFDGVDDQITLSTNINLGNGNIAWTVSAWVKSTTTVNGLGQGSVASNDGSGPVYSMMGINSGKMVYWTYQGGWVQFLGVATINDGDWHYLTWVNYSDTTMDMYVDGVFDKNVTNSTSGNNNPIDTIGNSWAARFDGEIAALHIYSKSLTVEEITQNYNANVNLYN